MQIRNKSAKNQIKKKIEKPGLSAEQIEDLHETFNLFDSEGTGKINPNQLKAHLESLGIDTKNNGVYLLVSDLDGLGNSLDFEQFVDGILKRLQDKSDKNGSNKVFDLLDSDRTSTINSKNLQATARSCGKVISTAQVEDILFKASSNGKEISRQDFYNIYKS